MLGLSGLDVGEGAFNADFLVHTTCDREPCDPRWFLSNGKPSAPTELVWDEPLAKSQRMKAEMVALTDLSEYPFDRHELYLILTPEPEWKDVELTLDQEHTKLGPLVRLAGWNLKDLPSAIETSETPEGQQVQQLIFNFAIERPRTAALLKTVVPLLAILFVTAFTLMLKPKSGYGRLAAATGGLMTVVMYQAGQASAMPPMSYLTRFDKFMLATYLVYVVNVAFSVAMVRYDERKDDVAAERAYKRSLFVVPGVAILAWALVIFKVV